MQMVQTKFVKVNKQAGNIDTFKTSLIQKQIATAVKSDTTLYHEAGSVKDMTNSLDKTNNNYDHTNHNIDRFGFKGDYIINGQDIQKGNQILLDTITSSVNRDGQDSTNLAPAIMWQGNQQTIPIKDNNNSTIGDVNFINGNWDSSQNHSIQLMLNVTTDKKYTGPVSFNIAQSTGIVWNRDTRSSNVIKAFTTSKDDYNATLSTNINSYHLTVNRPTEQLNTSQKQTATIWPDMWTRGDVGYNILLPGFTSNNKNIDITSINSTPDPNLYTQDFKRVMQLSGINLADSTTEFTPKQLIPGVALTDAQGHLVQELGRPKEDTININSYLPLRKDLADDLTPDQMLNETPDNYYGISKQKNGTYLVCFNLTKDKYTLTDDMIKSAVQSSMLYNVVDPDHKDQIMANTLKYNHDIMHNTYANNMMVAIYQPVKDGDTQFSMQDVTPNDPRPDIKATAIMAGKQPTKTATGNLLRQKSFSFVDDDNNGMQVGNIIIISGKTGDVKHVNMTIPENYVSANGQNPPQGDYQLYDKNDPVVFHLKHKTQDVTGTTQVKQIIHYVYANGEKAADNYVSEPVILQKSGKFDLVTKKVTWNNFDSKTLPAVTSPVLAGYTANQTEVAPQTVDGSKPLVETTVTYTPDKQQAVVTYTDLDNNKILKTVDLSGNSSEVVNYATDQDLGTFLNRGYELVNDPTNGKAIKMDSDTKTNQVFNVTLRHKKQNIADSHTVNETITYIFNDNSQKPIVHTMTPVTITRKYVLDLVTNKPVSGQDIWTNGHFDAVKTPSVTGYTPNIDEVAAIQITPQTQDINKTIIYTPNPETATINYVDDDLNKTIKTDTVSGSYNQEIVLPKRIDNYLSQGYILVSNNFNNQNYGESNNFEVHLKHGTQDINTSKDITRKIVYVFDNNEKAANTYQKTINYVQKGVKDLVTDAINYTYQTHDTFEEVKSPLVIGYKPSKDSIAETTVGPSSEDEEYNVIYTPKPENAEINYIDDTTGQTLMTDMVNGLYGDTINVPNRINNYLDQGYILVSNDLNGQRYADGNNEFNVHLKHNMQNVHNNQDITKTIRYTFLDHSQPDFANVQIISYLQKGIKDLVTGDIKYEPLDVQSFEDVNTKSFVGYTPSANVIKGEKVPFGSHNIEETVVYTPQDETATIDFIDDTNKTKLASFTANGKYGQEINFPQDPNEFIRHYTQDLGLKFVSSNVNNRYGSQNNFKVHFVHGNSLKTNHKTITRTIHFVKDANGQETKVLPDINQASDLMQTSVYDTFTGQVIGYDTNDDGKVDTTDINNSWVIKTPKFTAIDVPKPETVNADKVNTSKIAEESVTPNLQNQDIDVVYTLNNYTTISEEKEVKRQINFIDKDTNKILKDPIIQKVIIKRNKIYDADKFIGYGNVSDNHRNYTLTDAYTGSNFDAITLPDFTGYKTPDITISELTPNNMNNINDIDVNYTHIKAPVKQDAHVINQITYLFENGKEASKPISQDVTYTRTGIKDEATCEITYQDWVMTNKPSEIETPQIAGYTTDKDSVVMPNIDVSKLSKTPLTVSTTVHYTANKQSAKLTLIDETADKVITTVTKDGVTDAPLDFGNTVQDLISKHYILDGPALGKLTFNSNPVKNNYTLKFKHGTQDVTRNKVVKTTVKYMDENGNEVKPDQTFKTNFDKLLAQKGVKDLVTGITTWDTNYKASATPTITFSNINGYKLVKHDPINPIQVINNNFNDNLDNVITVVYQKQETAKPNNNNDQPVNPNQNTNNSSNKQANINNTQSNTNSSDVQKANDTKLPALDTSDVNKNNANVQTNDEHNDKQKETVSQKVNEKASTNAKQANSNTSASKSDVNNINRTNTANGMQMLPVAFSAVNTELAKHPVKEQIAIKTKAYQMADKLLPKVEAKLPQTGSKEDPYALIVLGVEAILLGLNLTELAKKRK